MHGQKKSTFPTGISQGKWNRGRNVVLPRHLIGEPADETVHQLDRVEIPSIAANNLVRATAPSEAHILTETIGRELDGGRNKSAGVSTPGLAGGQWLSRIIENPVVAILQKDASSREDIHKRAVPNRDLQNRPVPIRFQVKAVSE